MNDIRYEGKVISLIHGDVTIQKKKCERIRLLRKMNRKSMNLPRYIRSEV